jgi:cytochrome oxidase Cu insertion factor (SCO1/SenC/PrrC family)
VGPPAALVLAAAALYSAPQPGRAPLPARAIARQAQPIASFSLRDTQGRDVSLDALKGKGPILINFFSPT